MIIFMRAVRWVCHPTCCHPSTECACGCAAAWYVRFLLLLLEKLCCFCFSCCLTTFEIRQHTAAQEELYGTTPKFCTPAAAATPLIAVLQQHTSHYTSGALEKSTCLVARARELPSLLLTVMSESIHLAAIHSCESPSERPTRGTTTNNEPRRKFFLHTKPSLAGLHSALFFPTPLLRTIICGHGQGGEPLRPRDSICIVLY